MKIISVTNIKGGTGKTTTAINLVGEIAKRGYKVLLVDNDPQSNVTYGFRIENPYTLYDLYSNKKVTFEDCIVKISESIFILPNIIRSAKLESELNPKGNRENILNNKLETLKTKFDFIIIDNNPFVSIVLKNALTISDYYMVVVDNSTDALLGIEMINEVVDSLKEDMLNDKIECIGILRSRLDKKTSFSKKFSKALENTLKDNLFETIIYESVKYKESRSRKEFIQNYSVEHAEPYSKLFDEILERINKN